MIIFWTQAEFIFINTVIKTVHTLQAGESRNFVSLIGKQGVSLGAPLELNF